MTTVLTRMVARLLLGPVLVVAVAVLVKGYADVGDGFAAGVIAALGVLLQYLAFGRAAVERALPVRRAAQLAIGGLLVALAVAFVPVLAGGAPLQHAPGPGREGRPPRQPGAAHRRRLRRRGVRARARARGGLHPADRRDPG